MPTAKWPLSRVVREYKGSDNLSRVADLKTSVRILTRSIHKLILLSSLDNESN